MTFQQQAKDAIRASGGRITPQRELLLDLLAGAAGDLDAETLHRLASQQDPSISLPTVYRTLNTLEAAEVLTAHYVSSDHERRTYRVSMAGESVFHFTCRRCGKTTAFQSATIDQVQQELSTRLGAHVTAMCLCASGLCAACLKESAS